MYVLKYKCSENVDPQILQENGFSSVYVISKDLCKYPVPHTRKEKDFSSECICMCFFKLKLKKMCTNTLDKKMISNLYVFS